MKKTLMSLMLVAGILSICGCSNNNIPNSINNKENENIRYAKYEVYYNIDTGKKDPLFKGLEMYAWSNNNEWFGGLLPGTNRLKTIDEVTELQNLCCPINILKEIFETYDEQDQYYCGLFIVSIPPQEDELDHSVDNTYKYYEDYLYLCEYFGIHPVGK